MAEKRVAAWKCIQAGPYYKALNINEKHETQCAVGETFFGEVSERGGFICNQSNGLYVQTTSCEEVTWTCVEHKGVHWRMSPELSDKGETQVKSGTRISALPVPDKLGWLQDAATKMYLPINHPSTGDALFTKTRSHKAAPTSTVLGEEFLVVVSKPPTVPSGSNLILEKFSGNLTMILGCIAGSFCFPCGFYVCCMDLDQRQCWLAPDGRKFDLVGKPIVVSE
eukprot:Skav215142  [mRNA]  locus=scaffold809:124200:124871:+ [translate_table: standard]